MAKRKDKPALECCVVPDPVPETGPPVTEEMLRGLLAQKTVENQKAALAKINAICVEHKVRLAPVVTIAEGAISTTIKIYDAV